MIPLTPERTLAASVSGLFLGSFLNVCIARLPAHRSIAWPGSQCPHCHTPIRPWDNIPILSFVWLRGRCRDCRQPISLRYPLVEGSLPLLFVATAARFPSNPAAVEAGALLFLLLGLFWMDAETLLLPDSVTLPGAVLGLLQTTLPGYGLAQELNFSRFLPVVVPQLPASLASLVAAVGAGGALLLTAEAYRLLRRRSGLGLGDVKLAAMLGTWLGGIGVITALAIGVLLAASAGLLMLARGGRGGLQLRIPLGSFLCTGAMLTLFFGQRLLRWYFHFYP